MTAIVAGSTQRKKKTTQYRPELWYLDSGDNVHIVGSKGYFTDFTPFEKDAKETQVQGVSAQFNTTAGGVGTIELVTDIDGEHHRFMLHDVLYIPGLRWNLLSHGMIRDQRYKVYYDNDTGSFELARNRTVVLCAHNDNRLWPFTTHNRFLRRSPTIVNYVVATANILHGRKDMNYWHNAVGHINTSSIRDMANRGLVVGMKVDTWDWTDCETCHLSNKTYHDNIHRRASRTNDLIFADLMDVSANKTKKFRYLLVIVDAFSNFTSVFLLQKKSETNHCFEEYISWAEIKQGRPIKQVLTDKGGEFVNAEMIEWCKSKGITHIAVGPQAPQSNPCERANRTLLSLLKSVLKHAGLPLKITESSASVQVHELPIKRGTRQNQADVIYAHSDLAATQRARPAHARVPEHGYATTSASKNRTPATPKIGYMVGFSDASTAYKMLFPDTNVVKFVPDVRFHPLLLYKDRHSDESGNIKHWLSDDVEELDDVVYQSENNLIGQNIHSRDDNAMAFMPQLPQPQQTQAQVAPASATLDLAPHWQPNIASMPRASLPVIVEMQSPHDSSDGHTHRHHN
ncbi:TPA: LOW QUALITY PROTEIN: hypothetical protein N0F65_000480 [Lagenidium giganteum]|uniref:Integrase catalytic domain-containing protein n=1 Tax=Lagenidium giganteum TaxID=4803 RepID=A0AAV2Z0J4_9STRA|nr:TPA: LOW QUALITY PROTEIN: hypothetical protein N0F65_000480 [Lagenidium giganteum]